MSIGGLSPGELACRVWSAARFDRVFDRAGELSFFILLSVFPFLIFLTAVLGYVAEGGSIRRDLLASAARFMPRSAAALVRETVDEITRGAGSGKLSFGILVTIWAASSGMAAMIDGLNAAYEVQEARPWWKMRLLAIGLTAALAVLSVLGLSIVILGGHAGWMLTAWAGGGETFQAAWRILQWPLAVAFLLLACALVYRFAPNLERQTWREVAPGAVVAVAGSLAASFGFRIYLRFFSYGRVYGSLGAVIVLMLWLYLVGAAILIGGEVNSEIRKSRNSRARVRPLQCRAPVDPQRDG